MRLSWLRSAPRREGLAHVPVPGARRAPPSRLKPLLATARRYGLSASGPVATSGAHFLASLLFVRSLSAGAFGLFSFVLVIVPFAMSMTGALLIIPATRALTLPQQARAEAMASCLKMNLLLSALTMLSRWRACWLSPMPRCCPPCCWACSAGR